MHSTWNSRPVYLSDLKALPGDASCSCFYLGWQEVKFNIHLLTSVMFIHIRQVLLWKGGIRSYHRVEQLRINFHFWDAFCQNYLTFTLISMGVEGKHRCQLLKYLYIYLCVHRFNSQSLLINKSIKRPFQNHVDKISSVCHDVLKSS